MADEDLDSDLYATKPKPKKLFGHNWSQGFVSPFRATPTADLQALVEFLRDFGAAKPNVEQVVWDLGCGDAGVLLRIASELAIKCIGVDIDDALLATATTAINDAGLARLITVRTTLFPFACLFDQSIQLHKKDLLVLRPADFNPLPTVIFVYLLPEAIRKIENLLLEMMSNDRELVVIIESWPPEAWKLSLQCTLANRFYVYKKRCEM